MSIIGRPLLDLFEGPEGGAVQQQLQQTRAFAKGQPFTLLGVRCKPTAASESSTKLVLEFR